MQIWPLQVTRLKYTLGSVLSSQKLLINLKETGEHSIQRRTATTTTTDVNLDIN